MDQYENLDNLHQQASTLSLKGEFDEAERLWRRLLEQDPDHELALEGVRLCELVRAQAGESSGDPEMDDPYAITVEESLADLENLLDDPDGPIALDSTTDESLELGDLPPIEPDPGVVGNPEEQASRDLGAAAAAELQARIDELMLDATRVYETGDLDAAAALVERVFILDESHPGAEGLQAQIERDRESDEQQKLSAAAEAEAIAAKHAEHEERLSMLALEERREAARREEAARRAAANEAAARELASINRDGDPSKKPKSSGVPAAEAPLAEVPAETVAESPAGDEVAFDLSATEETPGGGADPSDVLGLDGSDLFDGDAEVAAVPLAIPHDEETTDPEELDDTLFDAAALGEDAPLFDPDAAADTAPDAPGDLGDLDLDGVDLDEGPIVATPPEAGASAAAADLSGDAVAAAMEAEAGLDAETVTTSDDLATPAAKKKISLPKFQLPKLSLPGLSLSGLSTTGGSPRNRKILLAAAGVLLVAAGWFGIQFFLGGDGVENAALAEQMQQARDLTKKKAAAKKKQAAEEAAAAAADAIPVVPEMTLEEALEDARTAFESENWSAAVIAFNTVARIDPNNEEALAGLEIAGENYRMQRERELKITQAFASFEQGEFRAALRVFYRLPGADGDPTFTAYKIAGWHNLGVKALRRGDCSTAMSHFDELEQLDPSDPDLADRMELARACREGGRIPEYDARVAALPYRELVAAEATAVPPGTEAAAEPATMAETSAGSGGGR